MEDSTMKQQGRQCPVCSPLFRKDLQKSTTSANLSWNQVDLEKKDVKNEEHDSNEKDSNEDEENASEMDDSEEETREEDSSSDFDDNEELTVLKKLPWKEDGYNDDNETMEEDIWYDLFVLELDCMPDDKLARGVWKMVELCVSKHYAIIIALTLYETGRDTLDHLLCEKLVRDTVDYWKNHEMKYGGDDFVKAVKRLEEEERKQIREIANRVEGSSETKSNSTESVICVPNKKLRFEVLNKLIEEDDRVETDKKESFFNLLQNFGELNMQRANRAWQIVGKLDERFQTIIGEVFYLTKRKEVDIELMLELVDTTLNVLSLSNVREENEDEEEMNKEESED